MKTIVIQSQNPNGITPWMQTCLDSVEAWSDAVQSSYLFLGEELFGFVPQWVLEKTEGQSVIATDLARLRVMQHYLEDGYDRVIWMDADMHVFAPERFALPSVPHAIGREVWVQKDGAKMRVYRKVHNAFLMSTRGDSFLPFYADGAQAMLKRAQGALVPQFIGPKFLTALHNMVGLHVEEQAGMLSPLALRDVLNGGGKAIDATLAGHDRMPAAFNLSASYCGRESDGVLNTQTGYGEAVKVLSGGFALFDKVS